MLGLNLAYEAAQIGYAVTGVMKGTPLRPDWFHPIQADLLSPGKVVSLLDEARPEGIIHCAALADLDACEADPQAAARMNAALPGEMAAEAAQRDLPLMHISTDAVFDGQRGNYSEADVPNPINVYSRTKLEGEHAVEEAYPRAIIARVNFYGWSFTGRRSLAEFFYNNLVAGKSMNGFTDVYFCPLLANDLARLLLQMLEKELHGLYHVASPDSLSKYEFGLRIARKFGFDESLIEPMPVTGSDLKAARSPNITLRVDKLTQALGEAPPEVEAGLARFHQLYQQGYPQTLQALAPRPI